MLTYCALRLKQNAWLAGTSQNGILRASRRKKPLLNNAEIRVTFEITECSKHILVGPDHA